MTPAEAIRLREEREKQSKAALPGRGRRCHPRGLRLREREKLEQARTGDEKSAEVSRAVICFALP